MDEVSIIVLINKVEQEGLNEVAADIYGGGYLLLSGKKNGSGSWVSAAFCDGVG